MSRFGLALTSSVFALCTTWAAAQTASGPFTAAQAMAGRAAYAARCAACHQADLSGLEDAVPLAGRSFAGSWNNRTTADLYKFIHAAMPADNPGSLDEQTTVTLVAFLLNANGVAPGDSPLAATTSVMVGNLPHGPINVAAAGAAANGGNGANPRPGRRPAGPKAPPQLTVPGKLKNYTPVTEQMLLNPPDNEWLMFRRNYAGWSHSPLKQIDTGNIKLLQLKWAWAMSEGGTSEATPLVHDGVMFLPNANDIIQALDVRTGKLIWENKLGPVTPAMIGASANRSLALYGDKVYVAANDAVLYALDAKTGRIDWQTDIADGAKGREETGGPMIIHGKVLVGMTGCGRVPNPDHCYISAYDPETGKRLWKFVTVALTGTPGGDTWNGLPDDKRQGTESWIAGTYDPVLGTTYWGTAQAKPHRRDERGSKNGETLYGN
ncbi:MAG TPA: PQQ-binding-like beta-propeller repeat protein, partial [Rhizomicrobium sp.]|nr:PQQ-binding-like beta-propeller repeat protein [Rhizomicrobium sp.]